MFWQNFKKIFINFFSQVLRNNCPNQNDSHKRSETEGLTFAKNFNLENKSFIFTHTLPSVLKKLLKREERKR